MQKETEKSFSRKILIAVWNFWTSPTGAFILAISAMALGYYQFYISRPILRYETDSVKLISSANQNEYSIKVKGKEYKDLYLSKVYLYNQGQQALSGTDVSRIGHDPIRIVIPEKASVHHFNLNNDETSQAMSTEIIPYEKDLILKFDFLNPDYQYVVNILHENPTDGFIVTGSALNVNEITPVISGKELKDWLIWGLGALYILLIIRYIAKILIKDYHKKHK